MGDSEETHRGALGPIPSVSVKVGISFKNFILIKCLSRHNKKWTSWMKKKNLYCK